MLSQNVVGFGFLITVSQNVEGFGFLEIFSQNVMRFTSSFLMFAFWFILEGNEIFALNIT
jgi:hypothetical protein